MFTAFTPEDEQALKGEFLDWTATECEHMSEDQFMTAQRACAQAWGALRAYMRDNSESVFSELCASEAPYRLSRAILDAFSQSAPSSICQHSSGSISTFKTMTVDQLCDAALTNMGFILVRDEFGVDIVGDTITFAQAVG